MNEYRIDPDFAPPGPTPADFFATFDVPDNPEECRPIIKETFDRWKELGCSQGRVTITGPAAENDTTGYPPGLWLEGWKDPKARQLQFGAPWPTPESAIYPPLTAIVEEAEQHRSSAA